MPTVRVLRPLGVAPEYPYPLDLPEPNANAFAARMHYSSVYSVLKRKYNVPVAVFPFGHKYGGPKNLLRFKGFIDIPYEYSTMKLYENIAFGIPMIIPTPSFLQELYDVSFFSVVVTFNLKLIPLIYTVWCSQIPEPIHSPTLPSGPRSPVLPRPRIPRMVRLHGLLCTRIRSLPLLRQLLCRPPKHVCDIPTRTRLQKCANERS